MLFFNLISTLGTLLRGKVFKKLNYVLNHDVDLLFISVLVLLLFIVLYYNSQTNVNTNGEESFIVYVAQLKGAILHVFY